MAVQAVRITHGDGGDDGAGRGHVAVAAVADGAVLDAQRLDLQHLDLERRHRGEAHAGQGADAVDADAQAHHVVLVLGEALDAGGVQDVPHRLVAEGFGDRPGIGLEHRDLPQGKSVFGRILGGGQV